MPVKLFLIHNNKSSPRKDGNSDTLAKSFARGAEEAGNRARYPSRGGRDVPRLISTLKRVNFVKKDGF